MIDTHVHFNHERLAADLPDVLRRAHAVGVTDFIVVGFDVDSSERAVALAESHPGLWATVGIHPHDALSWTPESAERLRAWAMHPRVVAIGEIGLDFYRDLSPRSAQFAAFREQLALAGAVGLPVVIHCRDAYEETLPVLEESAAGLAVILHCFAGTEAQAERAWRNGWFLGVDGPVTYKKNETLRAIVRAAPPECLLLETDAPYLTPEPFRGRFPNEPAHLLLIAEAIARARGEPLSEIDATTTANARRAFPKLA